MIIGITGTNGAGKGTVVEYLVKEKGFAHYSVRELLFSEIRKRGMPLNRNSTNIVGNELRKTHGPGYFAQRLLKNAKRQGGDAVIESIRSIGEAEYLKSHGAQLWGVDADRKTRFERVILRGSHTDTLSFEEFCAQEDRELAKEEKHDMNILGVMKMTDAIFLFAGNPGRQSGDECA